MTSRKITDEGVSRLPLREGRAELLEEIMAIPTENATPLPGGDQLAEKRRRRARWLPVAGAAAAVAAIAAAVAVPSLLADDEKQVTEAPYAAPGDGEIAVLDVAGWTLENSSVDDHGGELSYRADDQSIDSTPDNDWGVTFDIHWRPADQYAAYVEDREDTGAGETVEVLGVPGTMWHYSQDDHTVIREVVGDFSLEVRGSGMNEADYLALLDQLTAIEPSELDAHLPEEFVTADERPAVVAEMLEPIPVPDGFDAAIESSEITRYQLGVDVTRAVTCAWIAQFADAKKSGDRAAMDEAADAMATSRDWPILKEMKSQGGWSQVIWEYADTLAAGKVPEGYQGSISCS